MKCFKQEVTRLDLGFGTVTVPEMWRIDEGAGGESEGCLQWKSPDFVLNCEPFLSFIVLYSLAFTLRPSYKHLDSRNCIFSLCAQLIVDAQ